MTERGEVPADGAALAWQTVRSYENAERYRQVAGPAQSPLMAAPPAALSRQGRENGDGAARAYLAHSCDLTVTGGLGTALATPLAVCALADHYVVRRVGGAGVAALAATAVAASEVGRASGTGPIPESDGSEGRLPPGYPGLARATAWLAGDRDRPDTREELRIVRLLRPSARTSAAYRALAAAGLPGRSAVRRGIGVALAAARLPEGPDAVALALVGAGLLLGWVGVLVALLRSPTVAGWVTVVLALVLLVTVLLAAAAATAIAGVETLRRAFRAPAREEGFGLVPGVAAEAPEEARTWLDRVVGVPDAGDVPALTTWFADAVDDLAGLSAATDAGPRRALTFGDLWLGRLVTDQDGEAIRRAAAEPEHRVVDLRLVATDVTRGRPVQLPFHALDRGARSDPWLFCPDCWLQVLPERIVAQTAAAPPLGDQAEDQVCPRHGRPLRELPAPEALPVVVAARAAATVPGLLQALVLYRRAGADLPDVRDPYGGWTGRVPDADGVAPVTAHWFVGAPPAEAPPSMFDATLPRWPTVSLTDVRVHDVRDEAEGHWVEAVDDDAAPPPVPMPPADDGWAFGRAVLAAPWNWRTRAAANDAGMRGRVGVVRHGARAGRGPFLTDDEVLRLALRGHHAGRELRARFTGRDGDVGTQTGTDRYRWIRVRSLLRTRRNESLEVAARLPLLADLSGAYRVPAAVTTWFTPPLSPGRIDPAWADAAAALTHLAAMTSDGVLDWDTDFGAPPSDPDLPS